MTYSQHASRLSIKRRKRERGPPRSRCAPLRTDLGTGPTGGPLRRGLQGVVAELAGPDPHRLLDGEDPELAVTDLSGAGRIDDRGADLLGGTVRHEHREP